MRLHLACCSVLDNPVQEWSWLTGVSRVEGQLGGEGLENSPTRRDWENRAQNSLGKKLQLTQTAALCCLQRGYCEGEARIFTCFLPLVVGEQKAFSETEEVQAGWSFLLWGQLSSEIGSLPREAMQSLLHVFLTWLAKALSNLTWPHGWPCCGHEVGLNPFSGSFQPECHMTLMSSSCN